MTLVITSRFTFMSKASSVGRQRVIETAAMMLATRGLRGISIREVAKAAQAPLGSTYHHFPEGKSQIVIEAIEWAGERAASELKACLSTNNENGVRVFLENWRNRLSKYSFQQGCPIVAAAIENSDDDEQNIKRAVSDAFSKWQDILCDYLLEQGHNEHYAHSLSLTIISSIEGAVVLCRGYQNLQPFDAIIATIPTLIARKNSSDLRENNE